MLYEFHLTTHPLSAAESEAFADCCRQLGGKAVLIALPHGAHTQQPMLSFVCDEATWAAARQRMVRLADALAVRDFLIVRQKAEIPADCTTAFYRAHPQHPVGYFEWHGKIRCDDEQIPAYQALCARHNARLSANTLRGQSGKRFLTLRAHADCSGYQAFQQKITRLIADLPFSGCLLKQHHEYCVYDSRIVLDAGWI